MLNPRKPLHWLIALAVIAVVIVALKAIPASGDSGSHASSAPPASSQPAAPPGSPADWWAHVGGPDMGRVQADYFQAVRSAGAQSDAAAAALVTDSQLAENDVNAEFVAAWKDSPDPKVLAFYQHYLYAAAQYNSAGTFLANRYLNQADGVNTDVSGQVQLAHDALAQAKAEAGVIRENK
jgi:hypothetical protein